jgi:hypothetical protein
MFVPPSTEVLLTVLEGYGTVWHKQWLSSRGGKKAELPCPRCRNNWCPLRTKALSKFTNMDIGQREFGGWLPVGIKKFVDEHDYEYDNPMMGDRRR